MSYAQRVMEAMIAQQDKEKSMSKIDTTHLVDAANLIMNSVEHVSTEKLRELNAEVVDELRRRQTNRAMEARATMKQGDIVTFIKKHRRVFVKITGFNLKTVSGIETDSKGVATSLMRWKMSPTAVKKWDVATQREV